jgi:hydroxyethylthiazole kinase
MNASANITSCMGALPVMAAAAALAAYGLAGELAAEKARGPGYSRYSFSMRLLD